MEKTTEMKDEKNVEKISVDEYINNPWMLEVNYIPFDTKLQIVSQVLLSVIEAVGGLNSSFLRRVSTEVFIENLTNIDLSIADDNGLSGYDQLCYHNALDNLLQNDIGNEYAEFSKILKERVDDYIRTETNPAVTINQIYNKTISDLSSVIEYISKYVQDIDVEQVSNMLASYIPTGGEKNEG